MKRPRLASPRLADTRRELTLRAAGDRGDLEVFQLEIRRLAREHGFEVVDVRIERARRARPPRSA